MHSFWQHVSGTTLGPYDIISSISMRETVGLSTTISGISRQHQCAYSQLLAACPWRNIGPIFDHRQHFFGEMADPSRTMVEFFGSTNGPIHNFWQHVSGTTLGPYDTIGSISINEKVGPSATISRILWQHQWANSQLLAACLWKNIGPIQDHWQNLSAALAT